MQLFRQVVYVWRIGRLMYVSAGTGLSLVLLCKYEAVVLLPYLVSLPLSFFQVELGVPYCDNRSDICGALDTLHMACSADCTVAALIAAMLACQLVFACPGVLQRCRCYCCLRLVHVLCALSAADDGAHPRLLPLSPPPAAVPEPDCGSTDSRHDRNHRCVCQRWHGSYKPLRRQEQALRTAWQEAQ